MQTDFSLRPWKIEDLDILIKIGNNKKIADNMRDVFPHPYTKEAGIAFINLSKEENPTKIFAITINDAPIGSIGIFPGTDVYRKSAEIGYWIAEDFWGNGIATNVVKEIIKYGFITWDLNRIYAKAFSVNAASQRVLSKAGFKLEANITAAVFKNNTYLDEMIYSVLK
jgi:ribosomal-protein-alanine N-acetyltransferase